MSQENEMEALARAALYFPDIARGVTGEFTIEQDGWAPLCQKTLDEIHRGQHYLRDAGWLRDRLLEKRAPYTHNIDVAVYRKKFNKGWRWITVTASFRFGICAAFTCTEEAPW